MTTEQILKILEDAINKRVKFLHNDNTGWMDGQKLAGIIKGRNYEEIAHLEGLVELINGFKND